MNELRTEECYSMLSKVLIEREQLTEQLEYERSVRGKDTELETVSYTHLTLPTIYYV